MGAAAAVAADTGDRLLSRPELLPDGGGAHLSEDGPSGHIADSIRLGAREALARVDRPVRPDREVATEAVAEGADAASSGRDASSHRIEARDPHRRLVLEIPVEQADQQLAVFLRRDGPEVGRRVAQRRQRGVDGEAEPFASEEVEDLRGPSDRLTGERADDPNVEAVGARPLDAGHRPGEVTRPSLGIVDRLGTVEARAERHSVLGEELAQLIGQQPEVALGREPDAPRRHAVAQ